MLGLVQLLLLGLLVFFLSVVWMIVRTIGRPPRRTYASAVSRNQPGDPGEIDPPREFSSWTFSRRSAEMPVWDIPGDDPDGPTVVMTHGWGDSRIGSLVRLQALLPFVSRIIAWDMPGQGEASGRASLGVHEADDLLALLDRAEIERAVLFGWSMGAGVSLVAATDERVVGVIAEAPYRLPITPARNVLRLRRMPSGFSATVAFWILGLRSGAGPGWQAFDRAEHAARAQCPVLVLHGEHDQISPLRDGQQIADAAPDGEIAIIPNGGHNTLWTDPDQLARSLVAVKAFCKRVARRTGVDAPAEPSVTAER